MLASIAHSVPPRSYGPWEQVASTLTEGLVARGHDVTLFATADSIDAAPPARRGAGRLRGGSRRSTRRCTRRCTSPRPSSGRASSTSSATSSTSCRWPSARSSTTPVVTTIHGFSSERIVPVYRALRRHRPLRLDQRRRPASRPDVRGDHPPRHRHRPVHLRRRRRRLPAVPRTHPPAQGHPRGDRGRPTLRASRSSSPGSSRTRSTSSGMWPRTSTA